MLGNSYPPPGLSIATGPFLSQQLAPCPEQDHDSATSCPRLALETCPPCLPWLRRAFLAGRRGPCRKNAWVPCSITAGATVDLVLKPNCARSPLVGRFVHRLRSRTGKTEDPRPGKGKLGS
jgi:hypothetical protein